jgi:hypothetical protein
MRASKGVTHAMRDEGPVRGGVEHLGTGHTGSFAVAVLALAYARLTPIGPEENRADTARTDIYGE